MKVPAGALIAVLLIAVCSPAEAHLGNSGVDVSSWKLDTTPTFCCFSYIQRPVPRSLITSTYTTSSMCTLPAVILVTKKGKELCTDPKAPWVKAHLKHFQMQEH